MIQCFAVLFFPLALLFPPFLPCLRGGKIEKGLCWSPLRHKGCQGGLQCWGSGGKLHYPAGAGGKRSQKLLLAVCCILLFQKADGFLLSM